MEKNKYQFSKDGYERAPTGYVTEVGDLIVTFHFGFLSDVQEITRVTKTQAVVKCNSIAESKYSRECSFEGIVHYIPRQEYLTNSYYVYRKLKEVSNEK